MIILLAGVLAMSSADAATVGASATELRRALHIGNTDIGLLVTVSSLVAAAASLPFGVLADRVKRTRTLGFTVMLWGIAMLWSAASTSFGELLLARLALGVVTASSGPVVASMIGDYFPSGERGRVYGYILTGELVGAGIGFAVTGDVAALSWRAAFVILALPTFVLSRLLFRLPEPVRGGVAPLARDDAEGATDDPGRATAGGSGVGRSAGGAGPAVAGGTDAGGGGAGGAGAAAGAGAGGVGGTGGAGAGGMGAAAGRWSGPGGGRRRRGGASYDPFPYPHDPYRDDPYRANPPEPAYDASLGADPYRDDTAVIGAGAPPIGGAPGGPVPLAGAPEPTRRLAGNADPRGERAAVIGRDEVGPDEPEDDPLEHETDAQRVARERGILPDPDLVLHSDARKLSLWQAVRYVLRIRTNVILIIASACAYFYLSGIETFASEFTSQQYGVPQALANALILVIGIGAVAGVLVGGGFSDYLLRRRYLNSRIAVAGAAALLTTLLFLPAILTRSVVTALPYLTLAGFALMAQNPPIDAARLDIVPPLLWGRAEGVRGLLRTAAQSLAPVLFGACSELFGRGRIGLQWTFLIMLVPLLANGVILMIALRSYPRDVATAAAARRPRQL